MLHAPEPARSPLRTPLRLMKQHQIHAHRQRYQPYHQDQYAAEVEANGLLVLFWMRGRCFLGEERGTDEDAALVLVELFVFDGGQFAIEVLPEGF